MKIGETILKLREAKQMSQEEFAQHYHVTRHEPVIIGLN